MATVDKEDSNRIVMLETYLKHPPKGDFAMGYFTCLMDEAVADIDDAASDTFEKCLELITDVHHRNSLIRQRAITLR